MKKHIFNLILCAAILTPALCCISCNSNKEEKAIVEKLDAFFDGKYAADEPGAAVIVLRGDKVIYDKGFGLADLNTKVPIDGNTFFNICSMSKQFTATAILQLVEKGAIKLDDNVKTYYPEFKGDFWQNVQIHNLLDHSSGIPDARGGIPREQKLLATDSLAIAYMVDLDWVEAQPGEQYAYCNPTYTLMGDLVSRVTGVEFGEYMEENVFEPAGMDQTLYYVPGHEEDIPNMSHAYIKENGEWEECDFGETTFFATRPDGGIYTSTHQFVEWEKALRANKIISEESLKDAMSPHNDMKEDHESSYGYGWVVEKDPATGLEVIYHNGGNGGYRTTGIRIPSSNTMIAIFSNRNDYMLYEWRPELVSILK